MILDRLRRKKKEKAPEIPRSEFLKIRPVRNPALRWERNKQGNITIFIPAPQPEPSRKKRKKGLTKESRPRERQIQLDAVGSIVWEFCDGQSTMEDISEQLHKKYKLLQSEAEISLNAYFNHLSKRGLIGFMVPEETRARLEEAAKKERDKKEKEKR